MSWPRKGERVLKSIDMYMLPRKYFKEMPNTSPKYGVNLSGSGTSTGTSTVPSTLALVQGRWEMIRWSRASPRQSKPARG